MKIQRLLVIMMLAQLFTLVSCVGFSTDPDKMNRVDGKYFQDTGFVYHFADSCYFSQQCYPGLFIPHYKEKCELSCLIRADEERRYPWKYCIYIALPDNSFRIENGRLNLVSPCHATVQFLRLSNDLIFPMGEYAAIARFPEVDMPCSATEDISVSPGKLKIKLILDGGGVIYLTFNNIVHGTVFRFT